MEKTAKKGKTAKKEQAPRPLPDAVDVLIVGSGPHGLAMASRLLLGPEAMQDIIPPQESYVRKPKEVRSHLKKNRRPPMKLAVVDAEGVWMERWRKQFKALDIAYLRSHEMMHPDAYDHSTLSVWAGALKRDDFLFLEKLTKDDHTYHGPFVLPSNKMMLDFCKHLVKSGHLDEYLWKAEAESMEPCDSGMLVTVSEGNDTKTVLAKHVVIARGPSWNRAWPAFYHDLETAAVSQIRHAWDLFDNPDQIDHLKGKGVIIGGGLTSAHLCSRLGPRGHIELLIRRERHVKQYDLDLFWMGVGRRGQRAMYESTPVEERMAINRGVRDGGSITPELNAVMVKLEKKGLLNVRECVEVVTASYDVDGGWTIVLSDDEVLEADYFICATGTTISIAKDPLLGKLQESHPLRIVGGLPVLSEQLQWGDLPVHLMGNMAALELGPDAVNMTGAVRGAFRIYPALSTRDENAAEFPEPSPEPAEAAGDDDSARSRLSTTSTCDSDGYP
eukprot:TRINITY_DN102160_c0_g1_i1.p1 TRINITY_DN102160_c0_g1~~TRINITY_DN102160_c0_g1_i1.p1  ORF type:complete len:501 (+),score=68.71 TRINITY_DN102160_c0_g1_i1:75-1577(+)